MAPLRFLTEFYETSPPSRDSAMPGLPHECAAFGDNFVVTHQVRCVAIPQRSDSIHDGETQPSEGDKSHIVRTGANKGTPGRGKLDGDSVHGNGESTLPPATRAKAKSVPYLKDRQRSDVQQAAGTPTTNPAIQVENPGGLKTPDALRPKIRE